jgi:hypothetical protein
MDDECSVARTGFAYQTPFSRCQALRRIVFESEANRGVSLAGGTLVVPLSLFMVTVQRFDGLLSALKRPEVLGVSNLSLAFSDVLFNQSALAVDVIVDWNKLGDWYARFVDDNFFAAFDS